MANKRHATKMGLMGAVLGGLNFKLNQWTTERAEQAELRKLQRLEEIAMAREARADQRQIASDERQHGYRMAELDSKQDHDVALVGLNHEYKTIEAAQAAGFRMDQIRVEGAQAMDRVQASEAGANARSAASNATTLEVANIRSEGAPGSQPHILGSDGRWYPQGTPLPAGVTPAAGSGISFAPSASKQLPPGARRPGVSTAPAQRDFSGFSVVPPPGQ